MSKKTSYEEALAELETILSTLESGEVNIDELFTQVKRASELIQKLKKKLSETEKSIVDLLDKNE